MIDWSPENRRQKAQARLLATRPRRSEYDGLELQQWVKYALFLPAKDGYCVQAALKQGLIDDDSQLYLVEKIPEIAEEGTLNVGKLCNWKHPPIWHVGDLEDIDASWLDSIEYAFIDLQGALSERLCRWFAGLSLAPDTDLAVTFSYGWRYNEFLYDHFLHLFTTKYGRQFYDLSVDLYISSPRILLYIAVMKSILNRYEFQVCRPFKYKDSINSMTLYRFNHIRYVGSNGWPGLSELFPVSTKGPVMATLKEKRHNAAVKAWQTRRRRHNAAVKAWETRRRLSQRRNEVEAVVGEPEPSLAEKRHNAAVKAWEPRRRKRAEGQ